MISMSMFRTGRLVAMMVLVPPYLSATLALLLHAFRMRKIAVAALVLTLILSIRLSFSNPTKISIINIITPLPSLFCIIGVILQSGGKSDNASAASGAASAASATSAASAA
jgi:hypothetical protein